MQTANLPPVSHCLHTLTSGDLFQHSDPATPACVPPRSLLSSGEASPELLPSPHCITPGLTHSPCFIDSPKTGRDTRRPTAHCYLYTLNSMPNSNTGVSDTFEYKYTHGIHQNGYLGEGKAGVTDRQKGWGLTWGCADVRHSALSRALPS